MARIENTVFISYRRTDVYTALAVYENLKNRGYDVFFDYLSISSGDFEQILMSNIRARAHFLLILTPTALDRLNEPGDWLRREIETAMDEKRNIVPLFFKGFQFGAPSRSWLSRLFRWGKLSVAETLTGKLKSLSRYNGLNVHEDYFEEAMYRLRTEYLSKPLEMVLHPVSADVQKVVREEQVAADEALEQIEDVQELVKEAEQRAELEKLESQAIQYELKGDFWNALEAYYQIKRLDPLYPRVDIKIRELEREQRPEPSPPPSWSAAPWRRLGFVAAALLVLAFLVWGASKLLQNLPLAAAPDRTLSVNLTLTSQPITTPSTKNFTATPASFSNPTSADTVSPGAVTSSAPACYELRFVSDVSIPDNTPFSPGQSFTKTWKVENAGSCAWEAGFRFALVSGDHMDATEYVLPASVAPGVITEISIRMVAPDKKGTVRSDWRMSTASGQFFGDQIYVQIVVEDKTGALATTTASIGSKLTSEKDGMTLLYVPAGKFIMGMDANDAFEQCQRFRSDCKLDWSIDEEPPHEVYLDPFWIDETEVTKAMYAAFLNAMGNQMEGGVSWYAADYIYAHIHFIDNKWKVEPGLENHPVTEITWYGANSYCEWAGRRLPTEAEWEKAARGDDGRLYPWGNEFPNADLLNYDYNKIYSARVGSYPRGASLYGVMDLAGNVSEWVADWYDPEYYAVSPASNPLGPNSGEHRAARGSNWIADGYVARSTNRRGEEPTRRDISQGFRCAVSAAP